MPSTPSYMDSANLFLAGLAMAGTTEKVEKALDEMETEAKETPAAKTILGLGYLMEDKPWYDFQKGFETIKEAAESDEPFCWFMLGSLYLNGKPELPKDPISAKYWIEKAADAGYKDALQLGIINGESIRMVSRNMFRVVVWKRTYNGGTLSRWSWSDWEWSGRFY